MRALALIALLCGTAHANDWKFAGWSADGSYYVLHETACAGGPFVEACPVPGANPSWPTECANSEVDETAQKLDVKKLVAGDTKMPAGTTVSLASKKDRSGDTKVTVTVKAGTHVTAFTIDDDIRDPRLGPVVWRADHKAVAVTVTCNCHSMCDQGLTHRVAVFAVDLGGDRAGAMAANVRGMAATKKLDYATARTEFAAAIKLDDSLVFAHYNLASLASITGDLATVKAELGWLAKSKDKDAAAVLKKAVVDPDLDFASTDPDVRALLKLKEYPLANVARLVERSGVWSTEANGCDKPAVTLKLTAQKTITATVYPCKAKPLVKKLKFITPMDAPTLQLDNQLPGLGDQVEVAWTRCAGSQVEGSCFELDGRVFHRGIPHKP